MFAKLLKYDLRSVFKYWWIAAVSSAALTVIGGFCINIINVDYTEYHAIYTFAIIGLVLCIIGLVIPPVLTEVLILVRIYKHFFTDEGYLTFTLPVKKSQLINSKILMSLIFNILTILVLGISVFVMLGIGLPDIVFDKKLWVDIISTINNVIKAIGIGFTVTYIAEVIVLFIASLLMSTLTLFACLTVAAVITRKHKILVAIAIYYGASSILSGIIQFIMIDGSFLNVFEKIGALGEGPQKLCFAMILLVIIGFIMTISAGIHFLQSWLFERKLNLD